MAEVAAYFFLLFEVDSRLQVIAKISKKKKISKGGTVKFPKFDSILY